MDEDAVILTSYFRERHRSGARSRGGALIDLYSRRSVAASVLLRGIEGYGPGQPPGAGGALPSAEDSPLTRSRGATVNVLSAGALAAIPLIPAYSISKAAAFSLSQSLRALLAAQGVRVHAVLPGPTDTDMSRGLDVPKASPESVARAIFDGVESGEEEIFPDPLSASLEQDWKGSAVKAMERRNAGLVTAEPVAS